MQNLHDNLLFSSPINGTPTRGTYNPMQFVVRLRKDIHEELKKIQGDIFDPSALSFETIQAYSTFFHENIHWWQHVGSNFGFISSLKFPAQSHIAYSDLKSILDNLGAFKSIEKYDRERFGKAKTGDPNISKVLNYYYDLQSASSITFDPERVKNYVNNPYFDCVGHSFHMMWSTSIQLLATTNDSNFSFLPKCGQWGENFKKLRNRKIEGFYFGSNIGIPPFSTLAIYEGQARFSQLQYLYNACGKKLKISDYAKIGMLKGVYNQAMTYFLNALGEQLPENLDHPLIGLFLLVCDLAINPTEGFPIDIYHYESFIVSNEPGYRFISLCSILRSGHFGLRAAVQNYSKDEYVDITTILSNSMCCIPPYFATELVSKWCEKESSVISLLSEETTFKYQSNNLPIRLFFSKYLRFQQDKFKNPQFFCWPGINLAEHKSNSLSLKEIQILFNRHRALFVDDVDGDIYPMIFSDKQPDEIESTFNQFFAWNCTYDMVRKWIVEDGSFSFNYEWLTTKFSKEETQKWVSDNFQMTFGHHPNDFKIL